MSGVIERLDCISLNLIKIFLEIKKWHFLILMHPSIQILLKKDWFLIWLLPILCLTFFFLTLESFMKVFNTSIFIELFSSFYLFSYFMKKKQFFSNQNISIYFILSIGGYKIMRTLCYKIMVKNRSVSCIKLHLFLICGIFRWQQINQQMAASQKVK